MGRLNAIAAAAAAILALWLAPPAVAQPAAGEPPDAEARAAFLDGERAYAEGRYEDAIGAFERAFELSGRPLLLYNLANAYERLARYAEAAERLRRYLPDANEAEQVALRKRIARLDERAEQRRAERAELEALRARPEACPVCDVRPAAARQPAADPARAQRLWGYGLVSAGAVAIAAGTVLGVVARDANRNAAAHCSDDGDARLCTGAAADSLARERRFAIAADASVATGIAAAGVGAYLLWRVVADDEDGPALGRARVAPALGPELVGVSVVGRF